MVKILQSVAVRSTTEYFSDDCTSSGKQSVHHRATRTGGIRQRLSCLLGAVSLSALSLILLPQLSHAATYYVATAGLDTNPGTAEKPFATPQKGLSIAKAGDTVIVRTGTYRNTGTGNRIVTISRSGTASAPIVFKSERQHGAVLEGDTITPFGIVFDANVSYVSIEGFAVRNVTMGGIWANTDPGVHHVTIARNKIHNVGKPSTKCEDGLGRAGIFLNPSSSNFKIERNVIHDNGRVPTPACDLLPYADNHNYRHDHGLYAQGRLHQIESNIFYNHPAGYHIKIDGHYGALDRGSQFSHTIVNNTFGKNTNPDTRVCGTVMFFNNRTVSALHGTMKDPRALIQNNIFLDPKGASTMYDTAICIGPMPNSSGYGGHIVRNNITTSGEVFNESRTWTHSLGIEHSGNQVSTDARLTNPGAFDFTLSAYSPALDRGRVDPCARLDYRGYSRGLRPDVGAHERLVETTAIAKTMVQKVSGKKSTPARDLSRLQFQATYVPQDHVVRVKVMNVPVKAPYRIHLDAGAFDTTVALPRLPEGRAHFLLPVPEGGEAPKAVSLTGTAKAKGRELGHRSWAVKVRSSRL